MPELVQRLNSGSNLEDSDVEGLRKELEKYGESI